MTLTFRAMLLSTAYFPPVSWFALVARDFTLSADRVFPSHISLEACENYTKQTYRNRCYILSSLGREMLQVPVVHGDNMLITSIRADYSTPWTLKTERAIDTAYYNSPYFEYYRDDIYAILDSKPELLFDLNLQLIRFILRKIGIEASISLTTDFVKPGSAEDDWREAIHPKRPDTILASLGLGKPYYQVFSDKFGFTPDLSILDLLFNQGPDSLLWLK